MTTATRIKNPKGSQRVDSGLCALALMTKAPRAGKAKTRLTPPLTSAEAMDLSICFLRDTAQVISLAIEKGVNAAAMAVYTPVGEEEWYEGIIPDKFHLIPQRGDSLGDRLILAADDLFTIGFESVCLIDSDSPTLPPIFYEDAVRRLVRPGDRIVLGPSDDGGYYLIGLKKLQRGIFQRIDWSTKYVFSQTVERAAEIGIEVDVLPKWYDVDDDDSLSRLCRELFEPTSNNERAYDAPHTRLYLEKLLLSQGCDYISGRKDAMT
jgi:rSAM/selenodomain-associated transferase 1